MKRLLFAVASWLIARADAVLALLTRIVAIAKYQSFLRLRFRPRADDIFIVSYPKAGTTAMQMIVHNIVRDGSVPFEHIDAVVPWFEVGFLTDPARYDGLQSPRVFKTHRALAGLPKRASYIYLLRDPKDSCVSFYFHMMSNGRREEALPTFVERFVTGNLGAGSWFKHLEACCRTSARRRVLVVSFDDLALDLGGVVDRVSRFCGRELDAAERLAAVQRCGFGAMKMNNDRFDPGFADGSRSRVRTDFIRKGVPGDWVNHLTPGAAARIDQQLERTLRELGPVVPDQFVRIVEAARPSLRGTIPLRLDGSVRVELLFKSESDVVPWGIRTAIDGQPLTMGDLVQLEWHSDGAVAVAVERAEVASIMGDMMDLRLIDAEALGSIRQQIGIQERPATTF